MTSIFQRYDIKELSGRDARLLIEWEELDAFCRKNKHIAYTVRKRNPIGLPVEYQIYYKVTSIIGVEETPPRKPVFANSHTMLITLPNNYPAANGNPEFKFVTDGKDHIFVPWHPNIRYSGAFEGRVCLNSKEMGVRAKLKDLVKRVEQYLRYEMYHAKNIHPYPEDQNVAEWVREEAEPNGWLSFEDTAMQK